MSRLARLIAPGFPHHVTWRGNRRAPVVFEGDYCPLPRPRGGALPQSLSAGRRAPHAAGTPLNPVRARLVQRPQDWALSCRLLCLRPSRSRHRCV